MGGQSDGGTATETESSDGGGSGGGTASFDGWMETVGNYDGASAFDPPAVRVSSGTTVVWEWTGQGAKHNVAADGGGFESELSAEEGFTFEYTFSESGTYTYVCTPHRTLGMKGVVVVE